MSSVDGTVVRFGVTIELYGMVIGSTAPCPTKPYRHVPVSCVTLREG